MISPILLSLGSIEWEPIERLGGWAVVVLVVWWFMRQTERRSKRSDERQEQYTEHVSKLVAAAEKGVASFENFEREERGVHESLAKTQAKIIELLVEITREQRRLADAVCVLAAQLK